MFQGFEALTNKPKGYGVKHIDYGTVGIKVNAHIKTESNALVKIKKNKIYCFDL